MMKDITLGQYFPGNTFVHSLDPRTKLVFTLAYIIAVFTIKSFVGYFCAFVVLMLWAGLGKVPLYSLVKGLRPLMILIVFTALLNMFYTPEGEVVFSVWVLKVTDAGLMKAAGMVLRVVLLVMCTFLLTYTTTPMALTDALERLLKPLKKIGIPVQEMAMMMSIALRFIPTLIEETDKIINAQKARGADFESGRIGERAKALLPLLIPLFVSAFRRAEDLACAMESRCYHSGVSRTRMNPLKFKGADLLVMVLSVILPVAAIFLGRSGF